jgi:hypothetical protein
VDDLDDLEKKLQAGESNSQQMFELEMGLEEAPDKPPFEFEPEQPVNKPKFEFEQAPQSDTQDGHDSAPTSPFKISSQAPQPSPFKTPPESAPVSAFKTTAQEPTVSPFASGDKSAGTAAATFPAAPTTPTAAAEPKIIIYDNKQKKSAAVKLLASCCIFGLIGAACFAGISAIYFSIGRRAGIFFVALFASLGARLGAEVDGSNTVRWYAAFTAAGSSIVGKCFLVLILFNMYPDFTAEDWMNFSNPGKSAAIYFEQGVMNALSTDGRDTRSGQQKLDERFEREFQDPDSYQPFEEFGENNEDYEDEAEPLEFSQVFGKTFDIFDVGLILATMFLAFKFSKSEQ